MDLNRSPFRMDSDRAVFRLVMLVSVLGIFLASKQAAAFYQGRHVCHTVKNVSRSVPITQTYKRPFFRKDLNKLTYVTAYKTVFRMKMTTAMVKQCCPGWEKRHYRDKSCMEPICKDECQNGGTCIAPGLCMCPKGFAGFMCQVDIDECSGRHRCQQTCANTPGSYRCGCRNGFQLAEDERSCDLCLSCTEEYKGMQQQITFMSNRILDLESDKESLKSNLTMALTQYEAAMAVLKGEEEAEAPPDMPTSHPYMDEAYGMKEKLMPLDRLASLSQQISILEERMADCMCHPLY